jgi:hypothetical protein
MMLREENCFHLVKHLEGGNFSVKSTTNEWEDLKYSDS